MRLHHIGIVVDNIEEWADYYKNIFGLPAVGKQVLDPIQKVEVIFINMGQDVAITVELIRPVSEDSPVYKFLKKGGGLHHICFEVEDIRKSEEDFKKKGALILGKPVPGKGHNDRLTLWLYTPKRELVELVQKE